MSIIIPSIPSIIIPTNETIIHKEYISVCGGVTPVEKDISTWITVIYENWGIDEIDDDLSDRIGNLDSISLEEIDNSIMKIREGIRVFGERLDSTPYLCGYMKKMYIENLQFLLDFKEKNIEKRRVDNDSF